MKKILLSVALAAMCFMPKANAADKSAFYVGAEAGYTHVKGQAQQAADEIVNAVGGSVVVTQDTSTITGRLLAGYEINKNFALEVGYLHTGNLSFNAAGVTGSSLSNTAYNLNAKTSASGFDYAVLVKPFDTEELKGLYAKFGGHYLGTHNDVTLTIPGVASGAAAATTWGSGFLVGVGYQAPVSQSLDYRVAYTYYNNVSGISDSNANTLTVGVVAKF